MCARRWGAPQPPALGVRTYTIFLAGLLVRRLRHDERRCQAKYGSAWDAYRALVPYPLIPGVW
jgi:7-dehydrocholesterol reductase